MGNGYTLKFLSYFPTELIEIEFLIGEKISSKSLDLDITFKVRKFQKCTSYSFKKKTSKKDFFL